MNDIIYISRTERKKLIQEIKDAGYVWQQNIYCSKKLGNEIKFSVLEKEFGVQGLSAKFKKQITVDFAKRMREFLKNKKAQNGLPVD